jgi:exopolyphosphatase/guanosine-5'-triphosphate,3'-diphosphate pyrophosphatase
MAEIKARWEWRTFGEAFGEAEKRILSFPKDKVRNSTEVYILSKNSTDNTKIRDMLMDIKTLRQVNADRLEQWFPVMKAGFPLALPVLGDVFKAWKAPLPQLQRQAYSYEEFLGELVATHPELMMVRVEKERHGFMINGCIAEIADLKFDGKPIRTVAVEMEDPDAVIGTVRQLGLDGFENVNYLKALKRSVGMDIV